MADTSDYITNEELALLIQSLTGVLDHRIKLVNVVLLRNKLLKILERRKTP